MSHLRIAVRLESLGLPVRKALDEAARMGAAGVQMDAVGDLAPRQLSESGRRELRTLLRSRGLELAAIGCPLRRGLDEAEGLQPRIEYLRESMTLAYELGARLILVSAGKVPEEAGSPEATRLREALLDLQRHGSRCGTRVALDLGPDSGERMASYLNGFEGEVLGVHLAPAALLLHGIPPAAAIRHLAGRLLYVTARDVRKGVGGGLPREAALGAGDIDWLSVVEALEEQEYRGWACVVRDEGTSRAEDVRSGVAFLRRLLGS
jgi:sugar phosphate isomerase/epimerase